MPATTYNLADLFEAAADEWPDRDYIVDERTRRTFAEMDRRANQLAHHLQAQGIKPGDHVGIYALNRVEWVEALWAIFKIRAVWVNINYRYVEDELAYLFDNADLTYLIVEPEYVDRARSVAPQLPMLVSATNMKRRCRAIVMLVILRHVQTMTSIFCSLAERPACPKVWCGVMAT